MVAGVGCCPELAPVVPLPGALLASDWRCRLAGRPCESYALADASLICRELALRRPEGVDAADDCEKGGDVY